jgi:hypothetical protein
MARGVKKKKRTVSARLDDESIARVDAHQDRCPHFESWSAALRDLIRLGDEKAKEAGRA